MDPLKHLCFKLRVPNVAVGRPGLSATRSLGFAAIMYRDSKISNVMISAAEKNIILRQVQAKEVTIVWL